MLVFTGFKNRLAVCFGCVCWAEEGLRQIKETNAIAGKVILNQYSVFAIYTVITSEGLYGMFIRNHLQRR